VGNRLASAQTSGDWSYNANNELEGYDDVTFQYDANGNMTEKNAGGVVTKFFYNLEDRLERVEDGTGNVIATYYYDPFGRRLWKDVGGTRTCFFYNDEGLAGEYDAAGVEIKTYGWKPGFTLSTDPLFMKVGNQYYWYHNDHLGTPQMMTTSSGAVVWKAKYSSFGKAIVDSGSTVVNPLRFPGQYEDAETGLHYNAYRYYDPTIGKYLRVDPLRLSGLTIQAQISFNNIIRSFPIRFHENLKRLLIVNFIYQYGVSEPQFQNIYSYCIDDPVNFADPLGLWSLSLSWYWNPIVPEVPVGVGGTLTIGYKNGVGFANLSDVGLGAGAGATLDFSGGPPEQLDISCDDDPRTRVTYGLSASASVSGGLGIFGGYATAGWATGGMTDWYDGDGLHDGTYGGAFDNSTSGKGLGLILGGKATAGAGATIGISHYFK
jgi:RHS repeat-associated protein